MIFYMDFGAGLGWEDISDYVRDDFTITERACSEDYKYAINALDFTITYNASLFGRLHSTLGYVEVRVMEDDDTTYAFAGRFVPTVGIRYNGVLDIQMLSLTVEDYTSLLNVSMSEFVAEDMYILNPADTAHSIVHVLFTHLGLSHSLIDSSVSILNIVGAAVADEDTNALDFLSTLFYEYGWVPNWSAAGLFKPKKWIQDSGSIPTFVFNDDNILGELEESPRDIDKEAAKVYWYGLGERTATRVYTESLQWDEDGDFEGYPILRETYYPDEANVIDETTGTFQVVEQEYSDTGIRYGASKYIEAGYAQDFALEHADFTRILVTKNHAIYDRYDSGLIRDITTFGNKKARIRYWNPNITSRQLYYMHIDADITYTKSKCTSLVEYVTGTKRIEEYDSSFLFTAADADKLAQALAAAMRLGRYTYKIRSESEVEEGSFVSIIASNGISATGLVLQRIYNDLTKIYEYSIRSYDTNYLPVAARTVRLSSLSTNDAIGIATSGSNSPVFTLEGPSSFGYYIGESIPVNLSLTLNAISSDLSYVINSYQWYYRNPAGVDTILSGETNSTLTIDYNEAWYYSGITIICEINGKYSFTTKIFNSYNASFLGEFATDPNYSVVGDWYFYTGPSSGGKVQYTMYLWNGTAWIEDTYTTHIAKVYDLISSASSITLYSGGSFSPISIELTAKERVGSAGFHNYDGRFTIEEARSDSTYSNIYSSSTDEDSYIYVPSGTISSMRFRLYAGGGFVTLLDEIILPVTMSTVTIEGMTPRYWGSLTTAPDSLALHINDYYWDANTSGSGGGVLRYYTGTNWTEMTSSHIYYYTAVQTAITDMMIWATAQEATVAAASAVFNSIAVSNAFIEYLFAQAIDIPDGGRIRFFNELGVNRRAVELAKDYIAWLNAPDTTPPIAESRVGSIGRQGSSDSILMDGKFCVPVAGSGSLSTLEWDTTEEVIVAADRSTPRILERVNGDLAVLYFDNNGTIYIKERTAGVWGAETALINSCGLFAASITPDNAILIIYQSHTLTPDSSLAYRLYANGVVSDETRLTSDIRSYPRTTVLSDGSILLACTKGVTVGDIAFMEYKDGVWGEETSIVTPNAILPLPLELDENTLMVVYKNAIGTIRTVYRLKTNGVWGDEVTLIDGAGTTPDDIIKRSTGHLIYIYTDNVLGLMSMEIVDGVIGEGVNIGAPGDVHADMAFTSDGNALLVFRRNGLPGSIRMRQAQGFSPVASIADVEAAIVGSEVSAIGNWTSFTPPNITNMPGSWARAKWRRVGSNVEFDLSYLLSGGATGTSSLSLTAILAVLGLSSAITAGEISSLFKLTAIDNGTAFLSGTYDGNNFWYSNYASPYLWTATAPFTWAANDRVVLSGSVPVSQYVSNINLATDFTEYASNTSTADADDTTSFYNGSDGSSAMFSFTGPHRRLVRFSRAIQPTDQLILEFYDSTTGGWFSGNQLIIGGGGQTILSNGTTGACLYCVAGSAKTDVSVWFYQYRNATQAWSSGMTNLRWRVRKVSNGNMAEVPSILRVEAQGTSASAVNTAITWTTEVEDTNNCFTPSTGLFIAPMAGIYSCIFEQFVGATNNYNVVCSNATKSKRIGGTSATGITPMPFTIRLNAGESINIQNNTSTNFADGSGRLEITWIGK